jgi:hypothetical protein
MIMPLVISNFINFLLENLKLNAIINSPTENSTIIIVYTYSEMNGFL